MYYMYEKRNYMWLIEIRQKTQVVKQNTSFDRVHDGWYLTKLNLENEQLINEAGISNGEVNSDILELAKMSEKLTPEQRQKMIAVAKALFPEVFENKKWGWFWNAQLNE